MGRASAVALMFLLLGSLAGLLAEPAAPGDTREQYEGRLSQLIEATLSPGLKNYLTGLRGRLAAAGDSAARQALQTEAANAARVAGDIKAVKEYRLASAPLTYYIVPPMSDVQRLPGVYPTDGQLGAELRVVAARDEHESASFVVFAFADMEKVELRASPLAGPNGATLPTEELDLKVVKVWYQNGNGWFSYFQDVGLQLVPELLLHDESLVKVDTGARDNYVRVDYPSGSRYLWLSPPQAVDSRYDEHGWLKFSTFRPLLEPFADAKTLQPVRLAAGSFKQFWLTVHVPKGAAPGVYRGIIELFAAGQRLADVPVALRVLPFELPEPKTYFDPNRDFLVTLYSCPTIPMLMAGNGNDRALAEKQLLAMMQNMRRHNLLHPMMNYGSAPTEVLKRHLELMKEAGLSTKPVIGNNVPFLGHSGGIGFDGMMTARRAAEQWQKFLLDTLGHCDAYLGNGDEPGASWVVMTRGTWKLYHERGLKIFTAGHRALFTKGGYAYDMHPTACAPEEADKARDWNAVGHAYVGFYAVQHNGSENPAFVRRQHGLLSYLSNFSMVCNYEFALGPWNDRATELYKPMVLAYATHDGLVDTLAWEGFREGVDDIRYATKLKQLAQQEIASGKADRVYAGRKALQWLTLLDATGADLHAVRMEMVNRILELGERP